MFQPFLRFNLLPDPDAPLLKAYRLHERCGAGGEFQPFLRFNVVAKNTMMLNNREVDVSTLLEIQLDATRTRPFYFGADKFQPFLRFNKVMTAVDDFDFERLTVSTLLEIQLRLLQLDGAVVEKLTGKFQPFLRFNSHPRPPRRGGPRSRFNPS